MRRGLSACAIAALLAGCSKDSAPAAAADAGSPPAADDPFTTDADCGPGTRAAVGSHDCVPVGTTACAAGFDKHPSGWGCVPVLPPAACADATRPALGERACVPVGDCAAPFPPADAIVVDPSLPDASVDAKHVKTLADAVTAASDGATIALVDGTHDAATLTIQKKVTIAGRCASKTKLVPAAGATYGLRFTASAGVHGVTMDGIDTPLEAFGAGVVLDVEDVVLSASRGRGLFAQRGASASLRRSVVRGTVARSPGAQTIAVLAGTGATIEVEDSAVLDSTDAAIAAADVDATHVTVTRSVVDGCSSSALRAFEGAHLDVTESAVLRATGLAVLALHRNNGYPEVSLTRSVVAATVPTTQTGGDLATAINVAYGATATIDDSTIDGTKGVGVYSAETAKITLKNSVVARTTANGQTSGTGVVATHSGEVAIVSSAIVDASGLGAGAFTGGKMTIDGSLVRAIGGDVAQGLPLGFAINATDASTIAVTDSALVDAEELGVAMSGAGTHATLDRVVVTRTDAARPAQFGHAVLAAYGGAIDIGRSILDGAPGVGLFYAGGSGTVSGSLVRRNGIGAHVQEGSTLVEADAPPDAAPEDQLVVTKDVRFEDNATKTGEGDLPLPKMVAPP